MIVPYFWERSIKWLIKRLNSCRDSSETARTNIFSCSIKADFRLCLFADWKSILPYYSVNLSALFLNLFLRLSLCFSSRNEPPRQPEKFLSQCLRSFLLCTKVRTMAGVYSVCSAARFIGYRLFNLNTTFGLILALFMPSVTFLFHATSCNSVFLL